MEQVLSASQGIHVAILLCHQMTNRDAWTLNVASLYLHTAYPMTTGWIMISTSFYNEGQKMQGILDYESHSRNPTPTRLSCLLNSCHLFPTLGGLVHILISALVRFISMLGSPMKNALLYNDRYDHLVSFDQSFRVSLRSLIPSIDYTFLLLVP